MSSGDKFLDAIEKLEKAIKENSELLKSSNANLISIKENTKKDA